MHYIIFREKALENLRLAEIAFENKLYNGCVNRAYYSMFQTAVACLLKDGFSGETRLTHEKVNALFSQKYCNEHKIFPQFKGYLYKAQTKRNKADYVDQHISKTNAYSMLKMAKQFVELILSKKMDT